MTVGKGVTETKSKKKATQKKSPLYAFDFIAFKAAAKRFSSTRY